MEPEIQDLLEKYWKGETSVEEERHIKSHFSSGKDISPTGQYFKSIDRQQQIQSNINWKKKSNLGRYSAAATVVVGLFVAYLAYENTSQKPSFAVEDPREALEITRNALMMISTGLNEGKQYSGELKKINKAKGEEEES